MKSLSNKNFGLIIAFLLPGFIGLWGISYHSSVVKSWITGSQNSAPSVGGFLFVTLASLAVGLTISAIRWGIIDTLLHHTGVKRPNLDFSSFAGKFEEFEGLVDNHYRYYQYYANTLVAATIAYTGRLLALHRWPWREWQAFLAFLVFAIVLFLGSRDSLRNYYERTKDLLGNKSGSGGPEA